MSLEQIPQDKLQSLSEMARKAIFTEKAIENLETELANLKEAHRFLIEKSMPDMMMELGMSEIKLFTGEKLTMKPFYAASISEENQDAAFSWLRENNFDSIIKNEVKASFGKGDDERVMQVMEALNASFPGVFSCKASVHYQTLKSFVKEQVESGSPIPAELFNLHIGNRIIIK